MSARTFSLARPFTGNSVVSSKTSRSRFRARSSPLPLPLLAKPASRPHRCTMAPSTPALLLAMLAALLPHAPPRRSRLLAGEPNLNAQVAQVPVAVISEVTSPRVGDNAPGAAATAASHSSGHQGSSSAHQRQPHWRHCQLMSRTQPRYKACQS